MHLPRETASFSIRPGCWSAGCSQPASWASPAGHVADALRGYQNDDGGFGHGAGTRRAMPGQPSHLCRDCLSGTRHRWRRGLRSWCCRACDFLASAAADAGRSGARAARVPGHRRFSREPRTGPSGPTSPVSIPTAGLAGLLYRLGVDHPWRDAGHRVLLGARWNQAGCPATPTRCRRCSSSWRTCPTASAPTSMARALIAKTLADVAMFKLDPHADRLRPHAAGCWRPSRGLAVALRCSPTSSSSGHLDQPAGQPGGRRRLADRLGTTGCGCCLRMARDRHAQGAADPHLLRAAHPGNLTPPGRGHSRSAIITGISAGRQADCHGARHRSPQGQPRD